MKKENELLEDSFSVCYIYIIHTNRLIATK